MAAYAGRAGIGAEIFVPEGTSPAKVAAIESFGAAVAIVGGDRAATAAAAGEAVARTGAWYASHVYRPAFVHGVKTLAFELWEQLGGRAPGVVVVPAGNGTLVLGLWLGFRELIAHGHMARPAAIVAVQAERCAPLAGLAPHRAHGRSGDRHRPTAPAGQVRAAILASGGKVVTVDEEALEAAHQELARLGMSVEPTAAVAWAAAPKRPARGPRPDRAHGGGPERGRLAVEGDRVEGGGGDAPRSQLEAVRPRLEVPTPQVDQPARVPGDLRPWPARPPG